MSLRIHHVALRAPDPTVTARFYAGVLGMRIIEHNEARQSVWLDANGTVVMIERAEAGEPTIPPGSMELIALAIEELPAWRRRLAEAGVAIEAETAYTLYLRDPDGRRVGLSTYVFEE